MKDFAKDGIIARHPHGLSLHRAKSEEIAQAMYRAYQGGLSIRQIAKLYRDRYTHQSIHGFFKKRGFPLRKPKARESVEYRGIRFTLNDLGYFHAWVNHKLVLLQRTAWQDNFGPIPAGMVVHMKNGDRRDIRPENLELRSRAEIIRLRKEHRNQYSARRAL